MNTIFTRAVTAIGIAFALAAVHTGAAEPGPAVDGRYGSPVGFAPYQQEVRLSASTKSVTVRRPDIVRFVTADGREFFWRFDTERPVVVPLERIAPAGIAVPSGAMVYVLPEVPLAP